MTVELFICGDIVNYENEDGLICESSLEKIIQKADYSIGNFEAPVQSDGRPIVKSGPHHYQRVETIKGLKTQGFDLLCLANNHIYDYGSAGIKETKRLAFEHGLDTIGAGMDFKEAYEPIIKTINDVKIGFVNACEAQFGVLDYFTEDQAGYAWINHRKIDEIVMGLDKKCDFVIVLAHAGLEHYHVPQKEWRHRYKQLCDLGADVIVGSHPHVPQGYERYNESYIFYSLGNFYFDSKNYINKRDDSYSLLINLSKGKTISFQPVFHYKENLKVRLSPEKEAIDLDSLNNMLEENYEELHDIMTLEVYNNRLKRDLIYSLSPIPYDGQFITSLRRIASRLLGRTKRKNKNIEALHLLRNETYHNVFQHALEILSKEHKEGK